MQNSTVALTRPSVNSGLPERSLFLSLSLRRMKRSSSFNASPHRPPSRMLKISMTGDAVLKAICMPITSVHNPSP